MPRPGFGQAGIAYPPEQWRGARAEWNLPALGLLRTQKLQSFRDFVMNMLRP